MNKSGLQTKVKIEAQDISDAPESSGEADAEVGILLLLARLILMINNCLTLSFGLINRGGRGRWPGYW
jgi:hypothetical protein